MEKDGERERETDRERKRERVSLREKEIEREKGGTIRWSVKENERREGDTK